MSKDYLQKYRSNLATKGRNVREAKKKDAKRMFDYLFDSDPSYAERIYVWHLGFDKNNLQKEKQIGIRLFDRTYSNANGDRPDFMTKIEDNIDIGTILYDARDDEFAICTEVFNLDDINRTGKLTVCNYLLRFQDKNLDIVEYPVYSINATQYNSGERGSRMFTIGTGQHMLLLPFDENTVNLRTPKRFFLDRNNENPVPYIVTQSDTTSMNYGKIGIVRLTLYESVLDRERDNVELKICDYKEKIVEEVPIGTTVKAVIQHPTFKIKSNGSPQCFPIHLYDEYNNEITDRSVSGKWTVLPDEFNSNSLVMIDEQPNMICITVKDNSWIGREIKLVWKEYADITNGTFSGLQTESLVKIVSLFG